MDNKRLKRRKDKYNPYTLHTEKGKYYISFTDANNCCLLYTSDAADD